MRGPKVWRIVCALLLIANLTFIWGNSLLEGKKSAKMTTAVVQMDKSVRSKSVDEVKTIRRIVRKSAHVLEFASLGLLLAWGCQMADVTGVSLYTLPPFGGLTAACIDETIQHFVPGRSSELMDVWVDAAGVLIGMILFFVGYHVWKKLKNYFITEVTT